MCPENPACPLTFRRKCGIIKTIEFVSDRTEESALKNKQNPLIVTLCALVMVAVVVAVLGALPCWPTYSTNASALEALIALIKTWLA